MKPFVLRLHRWLSLAVAAVWLLQAVTGMLIAFHWEVGDALVPGDRQTVDFAAIEARTQALALPGSGREVQSLWNTSSSSNRYAVSIAVPAPGVGESVTIDGAGNVLQVRRDDETWANGGWIDVLVLLHHNLLSGDAGSWIIGLSGSLLLSNMALGLVAAWPRRRAWSRALTPSSKGTLPARRYSWHRALGLWVVIPAFAMIGAGTLLAFADGTAALLQPEPWDITAPPLPAGIPPVSLSQAVGAARALYPGAAVSGISYPSSDNGAYRVRLSQPAEAAQTYGQTTVFVDGASGRVIGNFDQLKAGPARRVVNALFAFHIGEAGGIAGRIAALLIGAWLATMIVLGLQLWLTRRRLRG